MQILVVQLDEPAFWSIHPSDPATFTLNCWPEWSLVNPILYKDIEKELSDRIDTKETFIVHENIIVRSTTLLLAPSDENISFSFSPELCIEYEQKLFMLLKNIRYASKQFKLSTKLKHFGLNTIKKLTKPVYPIKGEQCVTNSWHIDTAICRPDIELAQTLSLLKQPPSFDTVLLDALNFLSLQDYQTAILFAAISMENLARFKIDEAFDKAFSIGNIMQPITIHLYPSHNDEIIRKRREILKRRITKDMRFEELLHESSLLLLNRSLKMEDLTLFKEVKEIYEGRNKIIHRGEQLDSDQSRFSGIDKASLSIESAIQLVKWFGELGGYVNPLKKGAACICHVAQYK